MPRTVRRPSHAGDWYDANGRDLERQIASWLAAVSDEPGIHARAIISPHAGYRFCGHVMAYAYKHIDSAQVKRVFILGPSHHYGTRRCMLSQMDEYNTPLGPIPVDKSITQELYATGKFDYMNQNIDEAEHSLELQTSYLKHIMSGREFTLVPIMVGALSTEGEELYGRLLSRYLSDPGNLFIISSDFCHWGSRFSYVLYDQRQGEIYEYIEWLDRLGMQLIEQGKAEPFARYLDKYKNSICGRHPISVFLQMLEATPLPHKIKFTKYDQSSQCKTRRDSSVSYASAVVLSDSCEAS